MKKTLGKKKAVPLKEEENAARLLSLLLNKTYFIGKKMSIDFFAFVAFFYGFSHNRWKQGV